jgi:hypothetical protein
MFSKPTILVAKIFAWAVLAVVFVLWIVSPWMGVSLFCPVARLEFQIAGGDGGGLVRVITNPSPRYGGRLDCSVLSRSSVGSELDAALPVKFFGFGFWYFSGNLVDGDGQYERAIIVPHWFLALAALLGPARIITQLGRARQRQSRLELDHCVECGYDLYATTDRCPECGHPTPPRLSRPPRIERVLVHPFMLPRLIEVRDRVRAEQRVKNPALP